MCLRKSYESGNQKFPSIDGMVTLRPVCCAEHRSFLQEQPGRGAARMPLVFGGLRIALPKTLAKSEKHRIRAASGSHFLWILSFGETKESIPPAGAGAGIKTIRRDSDTI